METPNTRARKRLLDLQDSSVTWKQDDGLLRDLLAHSDGKLSVQAYLTSDTPLNLPTPTQRPRPIGSSSSSTSCGSNKRTRRLRPTASGSSSTPSSTGGERNRLDELLDRFLDVNKPSCSKSACAPAKSPGRSTRSSRTALSEQPINATPLRPHRSLPLFDLDSEDEGDFILDDCPLRLTTRQARDRAKDRLRRLDMPPPILRSSPRRAAVANNASAPSPLRGETMSPDTRNVRFRPGSTERVSANARPTGPNTGLRSSTYTATPSKLKPQPSSDGDTSIDSLDMMFQGGGEDIEMFLRAVDGAGQTG